MERSQSDPAKCDALGQSARMEYACEDFCTYLHAYTAFLYEVRCIEYSMRQSQRCRPTIFKSSMSAKSRYLNSQHISRYQPLSSLPHSLERSRIDAS